MRLRFQNYEQPVGTLSGGNQQKVVIAKWLATNPRVLLLDEPTQGIDVQAKAEVHRIICRLAEQGLAILMISSDMPELLGMCDRIAVMRHGALVAEFARSDANQFAIGVAATGATIDEGHASQIEEGQSSPVYSPAGVDTTSDTMAGGGGGKGREASSSHGPVRHIRGRGIGSAWLRRVVARREAGLIAALLAIVIPISIANPNFLSVTNLTSVSTYAALIGIVALGELLVMLTRNIDLSVSSVIGLTAYLAAAVMRADPHLPLLVPVALACGVGLACGLVNGAIVGYGGVPSIVVTLGTLAVFRGLDSIISNGNEVAASDVPQAWLNLTGGSFLGIPTLVWIALALFALLGALLRWTTRGRDLYALGSNPEGARLIGVAINWRILAAFMASGLLAGFDGALWASHYATVDGQLAYGLELTVVASVVVGGVALRGGQGTVIGVALGTFALLAIQNALTLARVDPEYLQAFYGAAIIAAVTIDTIVTRHGRRGQGVVQ